jgi:hypothetical protein
MSGDGPEFRALRHCVVHAVDAAQGVRTLGEAPATRSSGRPGVSQCSAVVEGPPVRR